VRRAAPLMALLVVSALSAASAWAQTATQSPSHPATQPLIRATQQPSNPATQPPSSPGFLSRYAFHLGGEHLSHADPRYIWDANYGGDIDLVDYGLGRVTFYANYQVILGDELHAFDPNQGNYVLGGRVSARLPGVEAAMVFHHESRHLTDRAMEAAVAWNMFGARFSKVLRVKGALLEGHVDARGVVQQSFVDYQWEIDGGLRSQYPVRSWLAIIADARVRHLGVDGSRNRGDQNGARGEAGIRLEGGAAAVELFVAAERRIDPYPLELGTVNWVSVGFRLANR
jgi:hypothetical protein